MAKFAQVGYGSDGRGIGNTEEGYTYIVNDNVRTGDTIQPIATNKRSNKKFVTTGVVRHAYKETSVKGQEAEQEAQENGASEVTRVYTGKELGVSGSRRPPVVEGEEPKHKPQSQYAQRVRAGNIGMYAKQNPTAEFSKNAIETFDSYSKKFMN